MSLEGSQDPIQSLALFFFHAASVVIQAANWAIGAIRARS